MIIPLDELHRIETERNITIIYAMLGGSRHFNNNKDDSDYDVFYIYEGEKIGSRCLDKVENYSFLGRLHSDYLEALLRSQSFYIRDMLRPKLTYISNKLFTEDYVRDLYPKLDVNEALGTMTNNVYNSYRNWSNINKNSYLSTKLYRNMLRQSMNYLWAVENNSFLYSMDTRVLVEYFDDRSWYQSAKYILANLDLEILERTPDLDELFREVMSNRN